MISNKGRDHALPLGCLSRSSPRVRLAGMRERLAPSRLGDGANGAAPEQADAGKAGPEQGE